MEFCEGCSGASAIGAKGVFFRGSQGCNTNQQRTKEASEDRREGVVMKGDGLMGGGVVVWITFLIECHPFVFRFAGLEWRSWFVEGRREDGAIVEDGRV